MAAAAGSPLATVNQLAPEFTLMCTAVPGGRRQVSLADYRGRWLGLLFYPKDFSFICPTELTALSNRIEDFRKRGCDLLGVSTDSLATHEHWMTEPKSQGGLGGLNFPLASDEDGKVCRAYGVYVPYQHIALRGLFLIDPNGVLQFAVVHNLSVGRRTEEVLRILAALQTGGLCPENWAEGQAPLDLAATLGPGSMLGSFRVLERLGGGSFGTVFKAYDTTLERLVALKVLRGNDRDLQNRVLAEARAAASIQHPNVCAVYAVDNSEGAPIITMEYVAGTTLDRRLAMGPLTEAEVWSLGRQIAAGMAAAHDQGVTHGDLKPANLMVNDAGEVKIMDFGLARREKKQQDLMASVNADTVEINTSESNPSGLSGTPAYMSPEQTRGEPLSPASDVFSFGLVLAELCTGRRVLQAGHLLELLRQIEEIDPAAVSSRLPEPFRAIVFQALQPAASQRTLTMRAIADQLRT